MNYKHAIYLLFPYFVMAILGSITQLNYNQAGPGGEMISFLTEAKDFVEKSIKKINNNFFFTLTLLFCQHDLLCLRHPLLPWYL